MSTIVPKSRSDSSVRDSGAPVLNRSYDNHHQESSLEDGPPVKVTVIPALDSNFRGINSRRVDEGEGSVLRSYAREFSAEFFGTLILVLIGTAVNNQVTLGVRSEVTTNPRGSWTTVTFGWGVAAMLGVVVSGGVSGGHINPAVTLALAMFRSFPWKKVPLYFLAQLMGAFVGSGLVYLNYHQAISIFEGGNGIRTVNTGSLYYTAPLSYMSNLGCFYNECLMSVILMMTICAVGDKGNMAPPKGLSPFVILLVIFAMGSTLGMQTSFILNPARDIGPRLMTWAAGYGGEAWTFRSGYWFWCATLAPVLGAFVGCFLYDTFIGTKNDDSILHNSRVTNSIRKFRELEPENDAERQIQVCHGSHLEQKS